MATGGSADRASLSARLQAAAVPVADRPAVVPVEAAEAKRLAVDRHQLRQRRADADAVLQAASASPRRTRGTGSTRAGLRVLEVHIGAARRILGEQDDAARGFAFAARHVADPHVRRAEPLPQAAFGRGGRSTRRAGDRSPDRKDRPARPWRHRRHLPGAPPTSWQLRRRSVPAPVVAIGGATADRALGFGSHPESAHASATTRIARDVMVRWNAGRPRRYATRVAHRSRHRPRRGAACRRPRSDARCRRAGWRRSSPAPRCSANRRAFHRPAPACSATCAVSAKPSANCCGVCPLERPPSDQLDHARW